MPKTFDVCIRGDGIVGRSLALLLARERLRVALVGRAAQAPVSTQEAVRDVRAYALNAASRALLEDVRAWPEPAFATPVHAMRVWGDSGGRLDFGTSGLPAGTGHDLAWIVDVPALEHSLDQALKFAPEVERIAPTDGAQASAKLTVICEGQKSSSRHALGAAWTVKPYDQKAVAARLQSDTPHGGVARQWFEGGEVLALLPAGGEGGSTFAMVWSVGTAKAERLAKLAPDELAAAVQAACGNEAGALRLDSAAATWPLALSSADRWVGPGWALAGDAAHTVHPLAGQGLNLGLGDVRELAAVIKAREYFRSLGDEKLLRRYERARKGDVLAMSAVTDGLHSLFAQPDARCQALRNWGMKSVGNMGPLKAWLTRQATG